MASVRPRQYYGKNGVLIDTNQTGQYSALLLNVPSDFDPRRTCQNMNITIQDLVYDEPKWCEDQVCKAHLSENNQLTSVIRVTRGFMGIGGSTQVTAASRIVSPIGIESRTR